MRADLRHRLLAVARGDFTLESDLIHTTGVTEALGYGSKELELQRLRMLRVKLCEPAVAKAPEPHPIDVDDAIAERLATIEDDGTVPPVFRKAWAALNCSCPAGVSADRWLNAVVAGGLLLDAWGPGLRS
jgi:hypothetical protein